MQTRDGLTAILDSQSDTEESSASEKSDTEKELYTYLADTPNLTFIPDETHPDEVVVAQDHTRWYYSKSVHGPKELTKKVSYPEFYQPIFKLNSLFRYRAYLHFQQFWIESAVLGGRLYRLFLGHFQPEMYSATDDDKYYRLSKEVALIPWDAFTKNASAYESLPVKGLTAMYIAALFLND